MKLSEEDLKNEIWKPIVGCEGYYSISNMGRVMNVIKGKLMKLNDNGKGYALVGIGVKSSRRTVSVHRLVAKHFLPNPENKPQVNHIDGVKTNNRQSNLEWATRSENVRHALRMGLIRPIPKGAIKPCSFPPRKVKDEVTGEIWPSARIAAKELSIKYSTIKSWLSGDRTNKSRLKYIS